MSTSTLALSTTHALAIGFATIYVGSLYISSKTRLYFRSEPVRKDGETRPKAHDERWRDDPDVIQARLIAVTLATICCCAIVFCTIWRITPNASMTNVMYITMKRLGLTLGTGHILPYLLAPLLFLGPLYAMFLNATFSPHSKWPFRDFKTLLLSWQGIRNFIVAPITEEIVFRACVLAVYRLGGIGKYGMIFMSPLSFGVAHAHHAWNTYNTYGRTSAAAKRAIMTTLFQLTYTTIFGSYVAFLFVKTGSIYPPITAHIFCNIMGIPQLGSELQMFPKRKGALIFTYVVGLVGFIVALGPWTGAVYHL